MFWTASVFSFSYAFSNSGVVFSGHPAADTAWFINVTLLPVAKLIYHISSKHFGVNNQWLYLCRVSFYFIKHCELYLSAIVFVCFLCRVRMMETLTFWVHLFSFFVSFWLFNFVFTPLSSFKPHTWYFTCQNQQLGTICFPPLWFQPLITILKIMFSLL